MTVSRTYTSPLREEQMEQTREKIMVTLAELLADESINDVSVAQVAERARISVRTAYRYFPTKDALLDHFNEWMRVKFGSPRLPTSLDEMPENAAQLIHYFAANERLMRASRSIPARELRKRRKVEQVKSVTKMVAGGAPSLDAQQIKLRAAAMHQMIGSDVWLALRDHWGLSQEEIIEAVQWGIRALTAQIHADDAKTKKRK